jgi:hypothetical protein
MEGSLEKETGGGNKNAQHLENIRTVSRVPGNPNYYEKDGLRTYGDDEDHDHEPPVGCIAITLAVIMLTNPPDDYSPFDVLDRNGFLMDWVSNSRLPVW